MTGKSDVHPITKEDLAKHAKKVDEHMESISRGAERPSLFDLVRDIGEDKHLMAPEVQSSVQALRDGFSLFYEMHAILEDRVIDIDSGITDGERKSFMGAYSMFAASSFIAHSLNLLLGEDEFYPVPRKEDYFAFDLGKDNTLNDVLVRYYGLINTGKRNKTLKEGKDLPKGSVDFFRFLRDSALERKAGLNHSLVELVDSTTFNVADEFTISGFEASFEDETKTTKAEFEPVEPSEVIGNTLAKQEMTRDMDRIALYDPMVRKNPIIEVGGLSPSVLYDGFPGTGKTTLFKMGRTRLERRAAMVREFWTTLNIKGLPVKMLILSPKVKTKWYGDAGQGTSQLVEEAQRLDSYNIFLTDDIDMMFSGGREESGGGDKDIMNVLMQFSSGIGSSYKGQMQWWAATNEPTALDPAMRQRFMSKYDVTGPETSEDFSDLLHLKLGRWIKIGLIDIELGKGYAPNTERTGSVTSQVAGRIVQSVRKTFSTNPTFKDLGDLAKKFKDENPRFTGRPIEAVRVAVEKRINDYDIPEEWYTKPRIFFEKPYNERVGMLKEMCRKVDSTVVAEELTRYAKTEARYEIDRFEKEVERTMHNTKVQTEALSRMRGNKNVQS